MKRILIWYRNDLRVHDHEPLTAAIRKADEVIPFYCFDTRQAAPTAYGFPKTGPQRLQFTIQSVENLSRQLRQRGGRLLVRTGPPEEIIPQCVAEYGVEAVYTHKEATAEEIGVEEAVEHQLWRRQVPLTYFWGHTLCHPDDLPFPLRGLPEVFTDFRKQVERYVPVRPALPAPGRVPTPDALPVPVLPAPDDFGLPQPPPPDARAVLPFAGGEAAALERVAHYLWQADLLRTYKQTRNGLLGGDFSSKLSPWLAQGCLSPRFLYQEVKRYERERVANESTYWLVFELLWRDYFRLLARKHGNALFKAGGIRQRPAPPPPPDAGRFAAWREGRTGVPFVDACMTELLHTGYLSNRGRQNAASFLVRDLGVDWRAGAAWFESRLLDYDPCSNYGNWNYVAGIGNDPRENRYFNVVKQARQYDPDGAYVKRWLPVLAGLPAQHLHTPHRLPPDALEACGVRLGKNYPHPLVEVRDGHMEKSA